LQWYIHRQPNGNSRRWQLDATDGLTDGTDSLSDETVTDGLTDGTVTLMA